MNRKILPFIIASKKYWTINLTNEVKNLYNGNTCLKKEIEADTRLEKDLPCSWVGIINIVNMKFPSKTIYRLNRIPNENPHPTEVEQIINANLFLGKDVWVTVGYTAVYNNGNISHINLNI